MPQSCMYYHVYSLEDTLKAMKQVGDSRVSWIFCDIPTTIDKDGVSFSKKSTKTRIHEDPSYLYPIVITIFFIWTVYRAGK